ncbi:MAG: GAF domain-containing protein [Anaerolineaceae bacterium]|nr:MAG: GAF domain-containing protein [Anaerolineaceae bacterium]
MAPIVDLLVVVRSEHAARYHQNLSKRKNMNVAVVASPKKALALLADKDSHVDVLAVDNNLSASIYEFVVYVRQKYPRLLIVLVDEEADFGLPGQADEMTTEPFKDDDLVRRIERLIADRRMETLRSDSLPAVRSINQLMKQAVGLIGKQEAAVKSVHEMGYDYVAYYHIESANPLDLYLRAHNGPNTILSIAPKRANAEDLMGWVAQNGQSRIAAPEDKPNHPLVARGRLGAVSCVPVGFAGKQYGVIAACRDVPGSITQENILMLELVAAQLAAALMRETKK